MTPAGSTRAALVSAMVDIIAEHGFDGLSVRSVAARAGVSAGSVQHHFPSKTAMLDAAMTAIAGAAGDRGGQLEQMAEPVDRLHALVDLLVPDSADSRAARVWLAFASRAAIDPTIRETYGQLWARLRSQLRLLVAAASGRPETAADASRELLALLDGLALGVVAERQDPQAARRLAHRHVDVLLGGAT